jgi:triacylglycerol lipase
LGSKGGAARLKDEKRSSVVSSFVERIASRKGKSSYRDPEAAAASCGEDADKPLVLLITGTNIVADFFDVMAERLKKEGFRPVVFQPPDLFTCSLAEGAKSVGEAVDTVLASTGEEKLNIIAECNGGVATRYWLERFEGQAPVDNLVTFVSAHHGTDSVGVLWCSSLADIKPGSSFLEEVMAGEPYTGSVPLTSIYIRGDEIMKPCETSRIDGALNIEVRDEALAERAKEREPYPVHHALGSVLIRMYPIHLAGFWDGPFFRLLVSCLKDDTETIRSFDELKIEVTQ